jgi:hypothetical protein
MKKFRNVSSGSIVFDNVIWPVGVIKGFKEEDLTNVMGLQNAINSGLVKEVSDAEIAAEQKAAAGKTKVGTGAVARGEVAEVYAESQDVILTGAETQTNPKGGPVDQIITGNETTEAMAAARAARKGKAPVKREVVEPGEEGIMDVDELRKQGDTIGIEDIDDMEGVDPVEGQEDIGENNDMPDAEEEIVRDLGNMMRTAGTMSAAVQQETVAAKDTVIEDPFEKSENKTQPPKIVKKAEKIIVKESESSSYLKKDPNNPITGGKEESLEEKIEAGQQEIDQLVNEINQEASKIDKVQSLPTEVKNFITKFTPLPLSSKKVLISKSTNKDILTTLLETTKDATIRNLIVQRLKELG